VILVPFSVHGSIVRIDIPATSNIYAATGTLPELPALSVGEPDVMPNRGEGTIPTAVNAFLNVTATLGTWVVNFPSITGVVGFSGTPFEPPNINPYQGGAAGVTYFEPTFQKNLSTDITNQYLGMNGQQQTLSLSGISKSNRVMFLVGVFVGPVMGSAPAARNEDNAESQTDVHPALGQVFYIGNGQGPSGPQNFYAPTGATKLVFGFADGNQFGTSGPEGPGEVGPAWYGDDWGGLSMTADVPDTVPEPGTYVLMGLPLAGFWWVRRRRG